MTVRGVRYIAATLVWLLAATGKVWAQDPGDTHGETTERELRQALEAQRRVIEQLILRVQALEERIEAGEGSAMEAEPRPPAADIRPEARPKDPAVSGQPEISQHEQERLVRSAFERTLIERRALLLPPGTVDIEPSLTYTHASADNIVIDGFTILPVLVVGDIVSESVRRETFQAALTARVGLPWEAQLDLRVPWVHQSRRTVTADNDETDESLDGLGDVTIGLSRQLTRSEGIWPDFLGNLRWKTRTGDGPFDVSDDTALATGTGYDSVSASLTGVKVVDPVVYFGSVSYSYNDGREEEIGRFDPGDSVGFSLGMALALNLSTSLSFAYDQQHTEESDLDGEAIAGSQQTSGVFSVGAAHTVSDRVTVDLSLGIGVTTDAPDVQVGIALPIRWRR